MIVNLCLYKTMAASQSGKEVINVTRGAETKSRWAEKKQEKKLNIF